MPVTKPKPVRKTKPQIAAMKRNRRVSLFGSFSGEATKLHEGVAKILGQKKLTIVSGARLGPVGKVINAAMGKGAKNISVIVDPWSKFTPNIAGKARNIKKTSNPKTGSRELHERLATLQTSRVKAYLFLPQGKAQFSGTMLELQSIINAFKLEPITNKTIRRPILLIGKEWKPVRDQIRKDYAKDWPKLRRYIKVIEDPNELKKIL
jgi:hypothetical protein